MLATRDEILKEVATKHRVRSMTDAIAPLNRVAAGSINLVRKPFRVLRENSPDIYIPRYLFVGPKGGAEPIRVGFFAGIHGNEPEGTYALIDFIQALEVTPNVAKNYCLFVYPVLNPTGFEADTRLTGDGVNIPNEIWKNSLSPEVQALQSELWMHAFDGIISFKTDPAAQELAIAVSGPIFFRHILSIELPVAQDLLPQTVNSSRNAFPAWKRVFLNETNELIRAAPGLKPRPFEILITIPRQAPPYLQRAAVNLVLQSILTEYRNFISFGANI